MFPGHCKEVSVKKVDFRLTEDSVTRFLTGKKAYLRTRFYIFNSGDEWAVAEVQKLDAREILQPIASVKVLALPRETSFVEDVSLDVLSASRMGRLREMMHSRCIVVRGKAEHVSFFIDEQPSKLTIFDVVPPGPSKLVSLVDSVLESDLQDRFVKYEVVEIDLNELAERADAPTIMFPCRASGLRSDVKTFYLDETPPLSEEDAKGLTLIGCSLSARIFKAVYGVEPNLRSMCPEGLLAERKIDGPVLIKCCKVREGFDVKGNVAIVPWGARITEVSQALRAVLG